MRYHSHTGRLTGVSITSADLNIRIPYIFDPAGNRMTNLELDPDHRLTSWPNNRVAQNAHYLYHHDNYGRLTRQEINLPPGAVHMSGELIRHYRYDHQHRLVAYACEQIWSHRRISESRYVYDPLGRRVGKKVWKSNRYGTGDSELVVQNPTPEVTWYGWDGDRLVTTQTESKRVQTVYQPGSFTPLLRIETENSERAKTARRSLADKLQLEGNIAFPAELISRLDRLERELQQNALSEENRQWLAECGLTLEQMVRQMEPMYVPERKIHLYHCDHRGLPLALINENGKAVWRAEYDEWGNQLNEDNPENLQQLIRLPGQQYDEETGLHYNRYRYYDPRQGRYITQDPIGLRGGWNGYIYPLDPMLGVDPLGLDSSWGNVLGDAGGKYAANTMSMDIAMSQSGASAQEISHANQKMCIGANGWNPGSQYTKGIVFGATAMGMLRISLGSIMEAGAVAGARKMSLGCVKNASKKIIEDKSQNNPSSPKEIISECVKGAVDSGLDEFGSFAFDTLIDNLP